MQKKWKSLDIDLEKYIHNNDVKNNFILIFIDNKSLPVHV